MKWFARSKMNHDTRPARIVLAEALRHLASGTITNIEFENWVSDGPEDRAVREIDSFAWMFYDDFTEHKLRGRHRLSKFQRQVFARCVIFLRTDLEYEYPYNAKSLWVHPRAGRAWIQYLLRCLTGRNRHSDVDKNPHELIDDRIWPFKRRSDYLEAIKHPVYLAGTA